MTFPHEEHGDLRFSYFTVCATNDSYEVYRVNEIYEDGSGLSTEEWPSEAEKARFIGTCSSPWK